MEPPQEFTVKMMPKPGEKVQTVWIQSGVRMYTAGLGCREILQLDTQFIVPCRKFNCICALGTVDDGDIANFL
jgi:hypothetical protein